MKRSAKRAFKRQLPRSREGRGQHCTCRVHAQGSRREDAPLCGQQCQQSSWLLTSTELLPLPYVSENLGQHPVFRASQEGRNNRPAKRCAPSSFSLPCRTASAVPPPPKLKTHNTTALLHPYPDASKRTPSNGDSEVNEGKSIIIVTPEGVEPSIF